MELRLRQDSSTMVWDTSPDGCFESNRNVVQLDVKLPSTIEDLAKRVNQFGEGIESKSLVGNFDIQGHGVVGMIIGQSWDTTVPFEIKQDGRSYTKRESMSTTLVRISFGPMYDQKLIDGERDWNLVDPAEIKRLHVSVYGQRKFFLKNYQDWGIAKHTPVKEEINFSLRWLNGNFDDWSDRTKWGRDALNHEGKYGFNEFRTSYSTVNFVGIACNRDDELEKAGLALKGITGTKELTLEGNGWDGEKKGRIGYNPMLEVLRKFEPSIAGVGDVTKMTPEQGSAFLLGKVLPAVYKFSRS